jgi:uncharacterized Fe-S cluster-containing MiaB family protein
MEEKQEGIERLCAAAKTVAWATSEGEEMKKIAAYLTCSGCHWLRRLFCIFACPPMNDVFARIDRELRREGK